MIERLSVVIPAYNAALFIAEAIDSVLEQGVEVEVVVVDDGSTDDTAAIVACRGAPVRLERQSHSGVGAALNAGLDRASGAWIAFLDADDRWAPRKLERQGAVLAANPEIDLVFGHVEEFSSGDAALPSSRWLIRGLSPGRLAGAMLVRRELFDRVGRFRTGQDTGCFLDWYLRAREQDVREVMLPDNVLFRRVHGNNLTATAPNRRDQYVQVIRASLQRRRGSQ